MKLLTPKEISNIKERESAKRKELLSSIKTIDYDLESRKVAAARKYQEYMAWLEKEFFVRRDELVLQEKILKQTVSRLVKEREELAGPLTKEQNELDKARRSFTDEQNKFINKDKEMKKIQARVTLKLEECKIIRDRTKEKYDDVVIRERRLLERETQLKLSQEMYSKQREEGEKRIRNEINRLNELQQEAEYARVEAMSTKEAYLAALNRL